MLHCQVLPDGRVGLGWVELEHMFSLSLPYFLTVVGFYVRLPSSVEGEALGLSMGSLPVPFSKHLVNKHIIPL